MRTVNGRCLEIRQRFQQFRQWCQILATFPKQAASDSFLFTIDNQLWRSADKMLWFSIPSRFSPHFSIKVNKHCLPCWDYLNNTSGSGENRCPTLQKNNQNKSQELPVFQNPLISVHITWKKTNPSSHLPKTQPRKQKDFISTTNVLTTCQADLKINISNSEEGQHILH